MAQTIVVHYCHWNYESFIWLAWLADTPTGRHFIIIKGKREGGKQSAFSSKANKFHCTSTVVGADRSSKQTSSTVKNTHAHTL